MSAGHQHEDFAAIHAAIGVVSAVCDYAREDDGRGFNAADAWLGHTLAEMPAAAWTSDTALAAWDMLRKYRGQLAAAGIDYDQLPRPEGADELEAERRDHARERAREHARQWRSEQFRKNRSYVRCDGDGEEAVLSFAYDPDLVAACRTIEGRVYDGTTKTNRYPFTSLPDVIKFAEDHGIDVTADVRALAAIAADRATELAAELAARPQIRFEASRHDQLVSPDGEPIHDSIAIDAPYDPDLTAALKELNGGNSTWDAADGLHRLPLRCATRLPEIAEQFSLRISDQARAHITAVSEEQARTRAAADAFEADPVPVPGLASRLALKPQQYPVVWFALEHRRVLIGDDMGWGKTLSSLAAAAADGAYPAVVVCRPSLTLNWSAEIRRFFPGLKMCEASGTTPQPVPPSTDVIVIGSAALAARPRNTRNGGKEFGWVAELAKAAPKALIIDEGQDTKERTANRSQACEQLAAGVIARNGLVLDLTGTAILNRPRELCQQLAILGRLDEFGGEKKFLWRYCLSEMNSYGANYNGARNLIELHDRLRAWGIMVRRSDDAALDLPPCREHVLVVPRADLNPDVMRRYREAETNLLEFLAEQARQAAERLGKDPGSAAVEAAMRAASAEHLVAINTLRQLAGQAKREHVTRWIRGHVDAGEKVMVAAHHRPEVDAYASEFGGLKLQGGQSVAEKEKAKKAFQGKSAAEAPVISVAIGAGGVGHTLTAARIGIQAEQAWTPGETQQMKKRLHRIGQDRAVDYYITVAEGTIDEQLWQVVTSKQATLDAVLDGRSDSGAAADETSVAAELTWRLTQQGLGNPIPEHPASGDTARATGVCAVCGTAMIIIEPGQTAHPMCDVDPVAAIAAVTGQPAPQEEGDDGEAHAEARISAEHLREFAHRYLEEGLLPVPAWAANQDGECRCFRGADCDRPGKHPRSVRTGPKPADYSWKPLACRTHDEVDARFADDSEYAAGNLMVAIPEGMMAIDRDDDDGGRAAIAALTEELGSLPPTLSHKTPHGEHLVYRTPGGWKGRAWVGKAPGNPVPAGIDLRMPGQILMAAPSIVPGKDGPVSYGPVTGEHVVPLPSAYVSAWTPPQPQPRVPAAQVPVPVPAASADRAAKYVNDAMTRIADELASRDPGGRNAAAYAAGLKTGSLLGAARATPGAEHAAWTDEKAEQTLLEAAQRNGYIDKDGQAEALRAIRSGLRNGLRAPRTLPDFTAHRATPVPAPRPDAAVRPARQPSAGQAQGRSATATARPAGRWQDMVPDGIRREIEAADNAAAMRRRAAIAAHQQAIEQHDRAATAATATEVKRTAAEARAAHEAYTQDGRHVTGRHEAAMLRWAASIGGQREQAPAESGEPQPDTARSCADTAAETANQAYRDGDLDEAWRMTEEAAASDPSRGSLWQQYRDQIDARRAVLASREAYHNTGGDWRHAEQLLEQIRQIDARARGRAIWNQDLPSSPVPQGGRTTRHAAGADQPQRGENAREGERSPPDQVPSPDWRDAFLGAERESWQPWPVRSCDPAVFREPGTAIREGEIEADP